MIIRHQLEIFAFDQSLKDIDPGEMRKLIIKSREFDRNRIQV